MCWLGSMLHAVDKCELSMAALRERSASSQPCRIAGRSRSRTRSSRASSRDRPREEVVPMASRFLRRVQQWYAKRRIERRRRIAGDCHCDCDRPGRLLRLVNDDDDDDVVEYRCQCYCGVRAKRCRITLTAAGKAISQLMDGRTVCFQCRGYD